MDSARPDRDALEAELSELRTRLKSQGDELEALRAQLAPAKSSRRDMLKASGLVGAGLVALTAVSVANSQPAAAIEGQNLRLKGPLYAYLTLKGQKQGTITGGVTQKGKEGTIQVQYMQSEIISPRDPASGLPTGKRQHHPFVLRKTLDQSTPKLITALVNNENISEFTLRFYKPNVQGVETQHFTIKLTNANIASFNLYHPDTMDTGAGGTAPDSLEELSFTYQKIEWTWVSGGITAEDDWESPIS